MKNIFTPRFIFVITAVILAAVSRILPHIDNVTPVFAMALFTGATLTDKRLAVIIPLLAMFLSDLVLGFHNTIVYVYVGFVIISCIGILIRKSIKPHTVVIASLVSSTLFFIVSNFGVWASSGFMEGFTGLIQTYELGIPFFRTPLLGDLIFNMIFFGSFYLASLRYPKLAKL